MGTTIRPELSEKNPYWIEKHRYYELKHFCLQYPIWRKAYSVLDGYANPPKDSASFVITKCTGDPTAKCAMAKTYYSERTDIRWTTNLYFPIQKLIKKTTPAKS